MMIEIDVSQGLMEEIKIEWMGRTTFRKLDYWNFPFRCMKCRKIGHLKASCPFSKPSDEEWEELASSKDYPVEFKQAMP